MTVMCRCLRTEDIYSFVQFSSTQRRAIRKKAKELKPYLNNYCKNLENRFGQQPIKV